MKLTCTVVLINPSFELWREAWSLLVSKKDEPGTNSWKRGWMRLRLLKLRYIRGNKWNFNIFTSDPLNVYGLSSTILSDFSLPLTKLTCLLSPCFFVVRLNSKPTAVTGLFGRSTNCHETKKLSRGTRQLLHFRLIVGPMLVFWQV